MNGVLGRRVVVLLAGLSSACSLGRSTLRPVAGPADAGTAVSVRSASEPMAVREVLNEETYNPAAGRANAVGTTVHTLHSRTLCTTPCELRLAAGEHRLLFEKAPAGQAPEQLVTVHLQEGHTRLLVQPGSGISSGWGFILGFTGFVLGAIGCARYLHDTASTSPILCGVGVGMTGIGVGLMIAGRTTVKDDRP